ncbi:MAG: transporter substrate-binding domain-containing protein [Prevotellaceae bacterium]|jgi:membrane-bound lytic murein transglycosylase F|nr:transporter substrate-binding domain-containing protein [Prevotellaceae bacterium]
MNKKIHLLFPLILTVFPACNNTRPPVGAEGLQTAQLGNIIQSDTLKIATIESATVRFLFGDRQAGYDLEMAAHLARHLNVNLKIHFADSVPQLIAWLENKTVDLIACNLTETSELKEKFRYIYPQPPSPMVIVQSAGKNRLSDVTELSGKTVHVKRNSIFHRRLEQLNDETGGRINIALHNNTSPHPDLIDLVANDSIDYTIAYSHTVSHYKGYYKKLDGHLAITFNQKNGWLIPKDAEELALAVDRWSKLRQTKKQEEQLRRRYRSKNRYPAQKMPHIPFGDISPYDNIFKQLSPQIGWDWRLLAALAFQESRFDPAQVSPKGALGVMQLMPRTARSLGLNDSTVFIAADNIAAGVKYIMRLNRLFRKVENDEERAKFVISAYNTGPAPILDAMTIAKAHGKNPHLWRNNVDECLFGTTALPLHEESTAGSISRRKAIIRHTERVFSIYEHYLKQK